MPGRIVRPRNTAINSLGSSRKTRTYGRQRGLRTICHHVSNAAPCPFLFLSGRLKNSVRIDLTGERQSKRMKIREDLTYKHYRKSGDKKICLVLHGGGTAGVESPFISAIVAAVADNQQSVFAFNMPYCERRDKLASPDFKEEVEALRAVLEYLRAEGYEKITIVAKSLGAIITSFYLEETPATDLEAIVLGYVIGDVKTSAIKPNLKLVIQGEKDPFGDGRAIRTEIDSSTVKIVEIPAADHSYQNADGQPEYQQAVIEILLKNI